MGDLFKKCYEYTKTKEIKAAGIYPYFHMLTSKQGSEVVMDGKSVIMIGSNNYLGLTFHEDVINAAAEAVHKYGTGVSGSRFLNGTLDLHLQLESELAEFLGKQDSMIFSTGFQSNLGIISAIAGRHDYILCDKENHASIYDACRLSYAKMLRYNHSDMQDLERQLQAVPESSGALIVTDGVFSMSGEICKLPEIVKLAKKYGARVMVDDAHGFGVLGATGRGTAELFGLTDQVDIIMGTFSKSLASMGGYMAADKDIIEYVRHNSRPFIFCAAIPPSNAAAALAALGVIKKQPERVKRLMDVSNYAREGLKKRGLKIVEHQTAIIPIFTYDNIRTLVINKKLFDRGVYANPSLPPAVPEGEAIIRTSYTSEHTTQVLDRAMDIIADVINTTAM